MIPANPPKEAIEAKLRAGETLVATRKTMAEFHDQLDPGYKSQLDTAMEAVEAVLALENPRTKTGDPDKLKAATAELDQVTTPLAEHAMDQALEAELRRRGLVPSDNPPPAGT